MVLTDVGIDLNCKNFNYLPHSLPSPQKRGIFELIDRFRLNLAQMVLTYVEIGWHYKNSNSTLTPRGVHGPPGGLFELIDLF